jgi:acylphosphatase
MLVARRFLISGRVQGVGFRFFAEDAARRDGLSGFVRNLSDGGLETVVEGDADAVERYERSIRHGPPGARVEHVHVEPQPPSGQFTGFSIRG